MIENIYFYYTNDFHSNFKQWSRVASFIKGKKVHHMMENESYFIFDIGDHLDRVHPITEGSMGKANVSLLNDLQYDVVTIGNNEGITLPHEELYHLYDDAQFQVVCANLQNMKQPEPNWLQKYVVFQSLHGVKIGVIGLTVPFNDFYHLLDWHISSPYDVLEKYIEPIKQEADIIVLLSHLGISEDREIARRFPDIDVIIGGHTHHLLKTGETVNQSMITAAGRSCLFVGEVCLTWDHMAKKLVNKVAETTDISHFPKDLATEQTLYTLQSKTEQQLAKKIVYLKEPIEVRWFKHTEIMQWFTDMLLATTNADCAMLNAGLLLDDLPAGNVTYKDIHRICPHPINPCLVTLKGSELMQVIRTSHSKDFTELKLKGFGFRGEVIGKMIFSNLEIVKGIDFSNNDVGKHVFIEGFPLDLDKTYNVATADTFTFGRFLPEVAQSKVKKYFLPEFLRDLLTKTLQEKYIGS